MMLPFYSMQSKDCGRGIVVRRTNVVRLILNKKQKSILKELCLLSSCVYNIMNYTIRQQFFNGENISGYYDLRTSMRDVDDYQLLGRSYASPRMQVYFETNDARFKLIKSRKQSKVGLPKYYKNRKTNTTIPSYLVIDNYQYVISKDYIKIPLSRQMRKKYDFKKQSLKIKYNGVIRWKGKQQRAQIRFKGNDFYFHQPVEVIDPPKKRSKVMAGLDLGIKKLLSFKMSNGEDYMIGNRRFYRQWMYYTNLIASVQSNLNKLKRRSSKRLQKLYDKRKLWQNNLFNNVVSKMFKVLRRNDVSKLIIGDVKGIRINNNRGRKVNQMVHNYWSFDLLCRKIENKAEECGIEVIKVSEEDTSCQCPVCSVVDYENVHDRIFQCNYCGFVEHRDIIGSTNILNKGMYGLNQSIHQDQIVLLDTGESCV